MRDATAKTTFFTDSFKTCEIVDKKRNFIELFCFCRHHLLFVFQILLMWIFNKHNIHIHVL